MDKQLRMALRANGLFSSLSGLTMLVASDMLSAIFGISSNIVFHVIGGGLMFFAFSLFRLSIQPDMKPVEVRFVIIQDWIWVVGSAILLIWRPFGISVIGNELIGLIAIIVAAFAIWQQKSSRHLE